MSDARTDRACPANVDLRQVVEVDLPALFEHQHDPEAARVAVVTPRSRAEFDAHWGRLLRSPPPGLVARAIEADGVLVGMINCFRRLGLPEEGARVGPSGEVEGELDFVGYWIARAHWGRGIATRALAAILREVTVRPVHARAATSNRASLRVLERGGFQVIGYRRSSEGDTRFPVCEEALLRLDTRPD
ncbi:MAG: GNAT family N-acetyltransferase [Myxococcales bacterium]|nr:GNAT family N-acetyltransferase [Myxococcales bacterium]MBL0198385.1 GNAT family N-acetyltransferase [Myxococcales bacterium]HQY60089.1 GNAT family N-acetyltransferase [Polyangiaceae bacterium]